MHNEHYKKLKIDTISLWKANKTLAQLIDACEFQIDKYNRRPKEGEETKDCDKIIFYSELKKDCYMLAKTIGFDFTYNDAFDLINNKEESKNNDAWDSLKYAFCSGIAKHKPAQKAMDEARTLYDSKTIELIDNKEKNKNDIYEVQEGSTFRAILGDKIEIIGESTNTKEFKFVVAKLNNGTEARLSKDLLSTTHFKKINH